MPSDKDKEEWKAAVKEGLKEWLNDKFSELGKWTMGALAAAILTLLIYLMLWSQGWRKQ